jgi:hypothetical protein
MKRQIAAGLSVLAVAAGVGWAVARHPETSATLQDISLNQHSERSNPGPAGAMARVRIRLSPTDVGAESRATTQNVPHIALATE